MGRVALALVASLVAVLPPVAARAEAPLRAPVLLFADTDDDDDDGRPDRDEKWSFAARDVEWLEGTGERFLVKSDAGSLRLITGQKEVPAATGATGIRAKRLGLQGVALGRATVESGASLVDVGVCEVLATDAAGRNVDLATSHASLSRTFPPLIEAHTGGEPDRDALAWTVACPGGLLPSAVRLESRRPNGEPLDSIERAGVTPVSCPAGLPGSVACARTALLRATVDDVDRSHPAARATSIRAEVGGRLVVSVSGRKAVGIRVGGPRESRIGAIDRFRGVLRFHVLRTRGGGGPAVGGDDAGARGIARAETRTASAVWGQCGVHFGPESAVSVQVVDPPPPHLLAVGCDLGAPATGGRLAFSVDGKAIRVTARAGAVPVAVASDVAAAIRGAGFDARVSPNARVAPGAFRSADVLVRRRDGALARITEVPDTPLSSDATLRACIGQVDLGDGLSHFDDLDAAAGTLEERALVKAYDDGDPRTIDVFVVPTFARSGRIGESFIDEAGSSIQNVVIIDRAAIRASSRSYALAHELGHVLLDLPGHPDDFGVDRPWALMDADAADPTIFGPRRLSFEECARAVVQSGPGAAIPLLSAWPLFGPKGAVGRGR